MEKKIKKEISQLTDFYFENQDMIEAGHPESSALRAFSQRALAEIEKRKALLAALHELAA